MKRSLYPAFCLACLLFFCGLLTKVQGQNLDSLRRVIVTATDLRHKVRALCDYAGKIWGEKNDSALLIAREALNISQKTSYNHGIGIANNTLGMCWNIKDKDSSLFYFRQAVFYCTYANESPQWIMRCHSNLIHAYLEFALYDSALHTGRKAVSVANTWADTVEEREEQLMNLYAAIGRTHYYVSNYDSSADYYLKAITIAEKQQNYYMLSSYYQAMGMINSANKEFKRAIDWGRKSVVSCKQNGDSAFLILTYSSIGSFYEKLNNYHQAKIYVDSSIALAYAFDSTRLRSISYMVLGNIETHNKNYNKALEYYQQGLAIENRKSGNASSRLSFQRKFAGLYLLLDNLPQAEQEYKQLIKYAGGDNELKADAYMGLSEVYKKQNDYLQAYNALSEAKQLLEEIFNAEKNKTLQDLNIKYETENREKKLLLLENEKLLQQQKIDRQNAALLTGSLLLKERERIIEITRLEADKQEQQMMIQDLMLSRSKNELQRQQLALSGANQQLQVEQQEKKLQQAQYERQQGRYLLTIVAALALAVILALYYNRRQLKVKAANQQALLQERLRISRELHDEVGATLSGVVMYSHFARDQARASNIAGVENSLDIIRQSSEEMVQKLNEIVWLVNPERDTLQKLIQRLEEYALKIAVIKGIKVEFQIPDTLYDTGISLERRRNIYLICKEAINNAVKYSNCTRLTFDIKIKGDQLQITITDNGTGFDARKEYPGNGFVNMRRRAEEIQGGFSVHSSRQAGSSISFGCRIK
ncbi:MAG: hypothetical protein KF746_22800 [Chitinophagaceae bacterium]|nr:hypothetical protein [Chitinophagaceae bacterium]